MSYATRIKDFLPSEQDIKAFALSANGQQLLKSFDRTLIWLGLLHDLRGNESTSVLLAATNSKIIEIWALIPLGLIHSGYSCLRTAIDIAVSYTFYCTHHVEWNAVCDGRATWAGRASIVDWHISFSPFFKEFNRSFGLSTRLGEDYERLSSFVHGIPVEGLPVMVALERRALQDAEVRGFLAMADRVDFDISLLYLGLFHSHASSLGDKEFKAVLAGIDRKNLAKCGITLPRA